ncbi:hypothetical protein ACW9H6_00425 [Pseudomonas sp. SDO528_S397]
MIRPFGEVKSALALGYYVVYRPECGELAKVQALRDWLLAQAAM